MVKTFRIEKYRHWKKVWHTSLNHLNSFFVFKLKHLDFSRHNNFPVDKINLGSKYQFLNNYSLSQRLTFEF